MNIFIAWSFATRAYCFIRMIFLSNNWSNNKRNAISRNEIQRLTSPTSQCADAEAANDHIVNNNSWRIKVEPKSYDLYEWHTGSRVKLPINTCQHTPNDDCRERESEISTREMQVALKTTNWSTYTRTLDHGHIKHLNTLTHTPFDNQNGNDRHWQIYWAAVMCRHLIPKILNYMTCVLNDST